jgi:hypothetical protein
MATREFSERLKLPPVEKQTAQGALRQTHTLFFEASVEARPALLFSRRSASAKADEPCA